MMTALRASYVLLLVAQVLCENAIVPEFTEHPQNEYIGNSDYAIIRCQAKYATGIEFKCNDDWFSQKTRDVKKWTDDDGVPHVSGSIRVKKHNVEEFISKTDYYCNCVAWPSEDAKDAKPTNSRNAFIKIAFLNTNFGEEPYHDQRQVGETMEINCYPPKGHPTPKVSWLKDGQLIKLEEDSNFVISYMGGLLIKAVRLKDAGEYVCMAENIMGTRRSHTAKIDVYTNGGWSDWTGWSRCPDSQDSCIKGLKHRSRACDSPPPTGTNGKPCVGEAHEDRECTTSCNIDGGWSNWSEWTTCSEKCLQSRGRKCNKPEPQNHGQKCIGVDHEHSECDTDFCSSKESFVGSLSEQPALIAGLAVVCVLFISALAVGFIVLRKVRKNKAKHPTPGTRCQTSRCSDLYDRYIPGYISTSASSAGDSSQLNNRGNNITEHPLVDNENYQLERNIIASKGADLTICGVTVHIPPDASPHDQVISLRVCGGDGPLLPPHQILLSPVVIVGPSSAVFRKPINLWIPHCINYNLEPISPAVMKNQASMERINSDNFYGWEIEVKPPGPQLKLQRMKHHQPSSVFLIHTSKPGAWALVGSPKVSNNLNIQYSSKSICILVYGVKLSDADFQIRIRVCDYLQSTITMIENSELIQPNVVKLCDKKVIGVTRSTSGLRIKLDVNGSCDWRCTMVTTAQEVSVSQLWRRAAAPVCFDLRKIGISTFLSLNLTLVQGHNSPPHFMPINHQIQ